MTLAIQIALCAALILSIFIPGLVFLKGERTKGRFKSALAINLFTFFGLLIIETVALFAGAAPAFADEAQAAAGLSHPNIVGVYDVGREGNINYIVMELIEGKTLNEIIEEEAPMDYRKVIDISKQVAAALRVAHKNKIIHRDVKPHNIMITNDGVVKLADFGIARAVNDATLSTGSKIVGSVH